MRREGSPWQGLGAVFLKELSDHLSSPRMRVLEWLIVLTGIVAVYSAIQQIRAVSAEDRFLFLRLFTVGRDPLPSFVGLIGFLIPLLAIGLGFDTINGEYNRRTLSRVLSQPIYRDALLFGKFLAGLATLSISLLTLWLLVIGLGLVFLGVPPSSEEAVRCLVFLLVAIAYGGVWLSLSILFSILFRTPATAALCTLGMWLLLTLLWPVLVPMLVQLFVPPDQMAILLGQPSLAAIEWQQALARISPNHLFAEVVLAILNPSTRSLGPVFMSQLQSAIIGSPLPLAQSLTLAWPQITGLFAGMIVLFTAGYVVFQRQEVRA
jgi:ABC-2 type transport system permease protein